jgi:tRNA (guanine10-N2)-dimethyltransferase
MGGFIFILSGAHDTLPEAEAVAVFKTLCKPHIIMRCDDALVITTRGSTKGLADMFASRLALTHRILRLCGISEKSGWRRMASRIPLNSITMPYCVRVHLASGKGRTVAVEKEIAGIIWRRLEKRGVNPKVDLRRPDTRLDFFLSKRFAYYGTLLREIDKKQFETTHPKKRPYFKPVSMDPRLAKAMVNLARVKSGRLLDPFCGTGGILIEAGRIGLSIFGVDKDPEMVAGTRRNLVHFGLSGQVRKGDATDLGKLFQAGSFSCVVTCPPYGRLSSLRGLKIDDLYQRSVASIEKVLKKGGRLVIAVPEYINLKTNMQLIEIHTDTVNRSLKREIRIYEKAV